MTQAPGVLAKLRRGRPQVRVTLYASAVWNTDVILVRCRIRTEDLELGVCAYMFVLQLNGLALQGVVGVTALNARKIPQSRNCGRSGLSNFLSKPYTQALYINSTPFTPYTPYRP